MYNETKQEAKNDNTSMPRDWPPWKKGLTVMLISVLTFLTNVSATMLSPGIPSMMAELGVASRPVATFAVSIYILGLGLGPMIFAPLSEMYGRTILYNLTNVAFVYFTALASVAFQLPVLVMLRFFQGCAASVPVVIGGGTVADLYAPETRGLAMSVYFFSGMLGPPLGPIAGAFISQYLSWRWIFGITASIGLVVSTLCFVCLRETHAETIIRRKKAQLNGARPRRKCGFISTSHRGHSSKALFKNALTRPVKLLLFDRAVLLLATYQALAYSYILFLLTSFSSVFSGQYGFSTSLSGVPYLGVVAGFMFGVLIISVSSDRLANSLARKNGGVRKAEYRLPLMAWSSWVIPTGLLMYGWAAFYKLNFMLPIVAASLAAMGLQFVMLNLQVYLSEAHPSEVASAIAAVTVLRCLLGSVLPVIGELLYETLGLGWGNSLLAFVAIAAAPIPFVVMKYGDALRTKVKAEPGDGAQKDPTDTGLA